MLNIMGKFNHAKTLYQEMGCYEMQEEKKDQKHLGVVVTCQICVCNALPQGNKCAVDFYQRDMIKLNSDLDHVKIFLDDTVH